MLLKRASQLGIVAAAAVSAGVMCFHAGTAMSNAAPQQKRFDSLQSKGPSKDGLAAFVFSERNKIKLGQDLPIHYGLVYLGDPDRKEEGPDKTEMKIWPINRATGKENRSWFTVVGPDGKEIRYIGPGVTWPPRKDPSTAITLHVGDFHGKISKNIFDLHKITSPGEYIIKWTYQVGNAPKGPWQGRLESNEIRVQVEQ